MQRAARDVPRGLGVQGAEPPGTTQDDHLFLPLGSPAVAPSAMCGALLWFVWWPFLDVAIEFVFRQKHRS